MGRFADVGKDFRGSPHYYLALLLFANLLFGLLGVVTRTLNTDYGMSMGLITFLRQLYSTVILCIIMLIVSRKSFIIAKKTFLLLVLMGAVKASSDYLLFSSYESIPIGLATLLQMTAPFFTILIMFFFFRENVVLRSILALILGTVGCVLCVFGITGEIGALGIIYGLLSGLTYAIYVIIANISGKKGNKPSTTLFYTSLFGTLMFIPSACKSYTDLPSIFSDLECFGLIFIMAAFMTLLPIYIMFHAVTKLGPAKTTMVDMSEFVFSLIFGYFFFNELINLPEAFGMTVIVLAVLVMNIDFSKSHAKLEARLEKVVFNASVLGKGRKMLTKR